MTRTMRTTGELTPGAGSTDHGEVPAITVRARVRAAIERAWADATAAGGLPAGAGDRAREVDVERPAKAEHGDFATNLAMKLARPLRQPPLAIAEAIVDQLAPAATHPRAPVACAGGAPP